MTVINIVTADNDLWYDLPEITRHVLLAQANASFTRAGCGGREIDINVTSSVEWVERDGKAEQRLYVLFNIGNLYHADYIPWPA